MKNPISSSLSKITPVILSGGAGTRLWPVSRRQFPKQFAALLNEKNLFSATLSRVSDRAHYTRPIIVGNNEHKFFILDALDKLNITDALVLLEPMGRNTAAAALTTALYEMDKGFSGLHLVMPSDHLVADETAFHLAAHEAAVMARKGNIVLFGINPEFPETGYGYITPGEAMDKSAIKKIKTFHEKPDSATAQKLIHKGALWNSGIFLYDPKVLCEEAKALAPDYFADCKYAVEDAKEDAYGRCVTLGKEAYEGMKNHAFDTLIMEQTKKGAVLPCSMGWNDIGSWQALWKITPKNDEGNALLGPVVAHDVKSSYIRSEGPTIAVLGMEDCMVVATKDAVMVAPCSRSQEIKGLLALVENNNSEVAHAHTTISRPWGTYESIAQGTHFRVKHIVVRPARSLSLQMHHHRAEHWVVVGGTALVECNGIEKLIFPNESIFIPQGASHRLTNPGKIDLQLIEVQSGEYLQEDDIVRFDDVYGRVQQTS
jgi:mannose-1-phosphate guanylyltransferase/mannose-6-phosphate isomerase